MTALGRMYVARMVGISVSAAQDLFEINPPADASVRIRALYGGQYSDAGDAESELLAWNIIRGNTTSGSGGGTDTPAPLETGGAAFGGTVERNNTTVATGGAGITLHNDVFNVATGIVFIPPPELILVASPSQLIVVRLPNAPADAITMNMCLYFEEIGG